MNQNQNESTDSSFSFEEDNTRLSSLHTHLRSLHSAYKKGRLTGRLNPDEMSGEERKLAILVNELLDEYDKPVYALKDTLATLSQALNSGKLDARAEAGTLQGVDQEILVGINSMLDRVIGYVDIIPIPIMTMDTSFNVLYMNKQAAKVAGSDKKQVVGKKSHSFFNTNDCKTEQCACAQAMKAIQEKTRNTTARPPGQQLEIQYTGIPIRDEKGSVIGAFEFIQDQTAMVRLMQYMQQEVDTLKDNLRQLSQGDLNLDLTVMAADKYSEDARAIFLAINRDLEIVKGSLNALIADTRVLAEAAQKGDLTTRADVTKHQGAFRSAVEGLNQTLDSVAMPVTEALRVCKAYAAYDFTAGVDSRLNLAGDWKEFQTALDNIGIQVSRAIDLITGNVRTLKASTEEATASIEGVSAGAQQVAVSTGKVSQNSEQGSQALDQILRAMEDLTITVGEVSNRAEVVSSESVHANEFSKEGTGLAKQSELSIKEIIRSSEEIEGLVTDINHQMVEIGKIVKLISDIASQTNLLALNAAIEAARAGDAGRGFAVVAAEVKSLAQDSRRSAEDIADLIANLQQKAGMAADAMNKTTKAVDEGSRSIERTVAAFSNIASSIESITRNAVDVASAAEEQAASVEEVTASINEVSVLVQGTSQLSMDTASATEETSASLDQITQVVGEINGVAEQVDQEIRKFRTSS